MQQSNAGFTLVGLMVCLFAVIILFTICTTVGMLIYAAMKRTKIVGRCRRCGYDLRGLAADRRACPECGQPFTLNARGDAVS